MKLTETQLIPFIGSIEVETNELDIKTSQYVKVRFPLTIQRMAILSRQNKFEEFGVIPICRKFQDLTKEIEVNGDRFIPTERLMDEIYDNWSCMVISVKYVGEGLVSFVDDRDKPFASIGIDGNGTMSVNGPSEWGRRLEQWAFPHLLPPGSWKEREE